MVRAWPDRGQECRIEADARVRTSGADTVALDDGKQECRSSTIRIPFVLSSATRGVGVGRVLRSHGVIVGREFTPDRRLRIGKAFEGVEQALEQRVGPLTQRGRSAVGRRSSLEDDAAFRRSETGRPGDHTSGRLGVVRRGRVCNRNRGGRRRTTSEGDPSRSWLARLGDRIGEAARRRPGRPSPSSVSKSIVRGSRRRSAAGGRRCAGRASSASRPAMASRAVAGSSQPGAGAGPPTRSLPASRPRSSKSEATADDVALFLATAPHLGPERILRVPRDLSFSARPRAPQAGDLLL